MSIDRSLRAKSSLVRHRNVLTRAERVALLMDQGTLEAEGSALGLPKVANRKAKTAKTKEEKAAAETTEAEAPAES